MVRGRSLMNLKILFIEVPRGDGFANAKLMVDGRGEKTQRGGGCVSLGDARLVAPPRMLHSAQMHAHRTHT